MVKANFDQLIANFQRVIKLLKILEKSGWTLDDLNALTENPRVRDMVHLMIVNWAHRTVTASLPNLTDEGGITIGVQIGRTAPSCVQEEQYSQQIVPDEHSKPKRVRNFISVDDFEKRNYDTNIVSIVWKKKYQIFVRVDVTETTTHLTWNAYLVEENRHPLISTGRSSREDFEDRIRDAIGFYELKQKEQK